MHRVFCSEHKLQIRTLPDRTDCLCRHIYGYLSLGDGGSLREVVSFYKPAYKDPLARRPWIYLS